jgi:hypothetical protein
MNQDRSIRNQTNNLSISVNRQLPNGKPATAYIVRLYKFLKKQQPTILALLLAPRQMPKRSSQAARLDPIAWASVFNKTHRFGGG